MTTLSLGQAARLTGRGKTILARAISGRFFTGSKEDGDHETAPPSRRVSTHSLLLSRPWPSCAPVSPWPSSG